MHTEKQQHKPWKPDKPVSKGASAYHEAVSIARYYIIILDKLIEIVGSKINNGDLVVDFGAGTGVSALRLLEYLKVDIKLWLVDNSPAWLGKAHQVLGSNQKVKCFLLEKTDKGYTNLTDTVGKGIVDHVISANTVHLVPDIEETFKGIVNALRDGGTFTFQSGNITRDNRPDGALMVDDTVKRVHDIALNIVRTDSRFVSYKKDLDKRIKMNEPQRKFVFPDPRPIEFYLETLKQTGFEYQEPHYQLFKVDYNDWLNFLRVRRLQAGILPEIGGHDPSPKEESDRDALITLATKKLFKELQDNNPLADDKSFTIEVVYVSAKKQKLALLLKNKLILAGKTALVTGASRGIGRAIAIELAKNGANVVVNYNKNEKEALKVVDEIKNDAKGIAVKADVSDYNQVKDMIIKIREKFGSLDILVNNAGIIMDKTLQNMEINEWTSVIKTNLNGIFNVTQNALTLMNKGGRIINISSIVALDGNFGQSNYAASKAGIIGFTKSLAKELGKHGTTVNVIAPGFIETEILKAIPSAKKKEFTKAIPLRYIGKPQDVADLAVFLASKRAAYITGDVICVNGGLRF